MPIRQGGRLAKYAITCPRLSILRFTSLPCTLQPMRWKRVLCQIQPNRRNLTHGLPLFLLDG